MNYRDENQSRKRRLNDSSTSGSNDGTINDVPKVPGRLVSLELEDFMCHAKMRLAFDTRHCNCFYIVGPNGSGKSAIFAGLNIGLGGRGRANDRGDNVQSYIREGRSCARIKVTLTNEGPNCHPEYDREIVVERMISGSKSVFTLKSRNAKGHEQVVSRKKVDLDALLQHFSIELENPLSWLSQDRSRQFLQDMKPEKLYEMFMITTQQETTQMLYNQISDYIKEMSQCLVQCEERKGRMKKEYEDMVAQHRAAKRIEENKRDLSQLCWILLWAPIRDLDMKLEEEKGKLKKLAEMKGEFGQKLLQLEEQGAVIDEEREEFMQRIRSLKEDAAKVTSEHLAIKERLDRCHRQIGDVQHQIRRKKQDVDSADKDIRQTEIELGKLVGGSELSRNLDEEEQLIKRERGELKRKIGELDTEFEEAKELEKQREEEMAEARSKTQGSEYAIRRLEEKKEAIMRDKEMWAAAKRNRMTRFGMDVPKVLELIEQNANRFRAKPIGPIGSYIRLRDSNWASPVEFTLKKLLGSFICSCPEDRRTLDQLCRSNGVRIPEQIITRFATSRFNTTPNEPPRNFTTILRAIDISDPTVFNVVCDSAQIEKKLLIEGNDEARILMRDKPPHNAREAVTLSCHQAIASVGEKPYRYYGNQKYNPRILVENSTESNRNFGEEVQNLQAEIEQLKRSTAEQSADKRMAEEALKSARNQLGRLREEKKRLEEAMKALEKRNEEIQKILSSGDLIQNLREAVAESRRVREVISDELDTLKRKAAELEEQKLKIGIEEASAQTKKKNIAKKLEENETNVGQNRKLQEENQELIRRAKEKISKCDSLASKTEDLLETMSEEKQKKQIKCNDNKKEFLQPPHFDDPPDFNKIPSTDDLRNELKNLEDAIQMEEQRNTNQPPTVESIRIFTENYKAFSARLKYFTQIVKRFQSTVSSHFERFNVLKFALPLKLSRAFEAQMSMKQYVGTLKVDHENRSISITAETHKRTDAATTSVGAINVSSMAARGGSRMTSRERTIVSPTEVLPGAGKRKMAQDIRGLSGGERSYTTACFVMALWNCVQSPFRCLDEFDIFMDHYNRRIVIEMLMEMAEASRDTQFVFFTPQGVSGLGNRDNIQVFALSKST